MSKEQQIRDKAYEIWVSDGRPDGRADQHWTQAEMEIAATSESDIAPQGKIVTERKSSTVVRLKKGGVRS